MEGGTFGPEDGLVFQSGIVQLGSGGTAGQAFDATVFWRGSSYASTDHPSPLAYNARSRAMANIWQERRVIRASFKYVRGGNDVISWQHSNAVVSGVCTWSSGPRETHSVWDSLNPNAPKTEFRYNFALVSRGAC